MAVLNIAKRCSLFVRISKYLGAKVETHVDLDILGERKRLDLVRPHRYVLGIPSLSLPCVELV